MIFVTGRFFTEGGSVREVVHYNLNLVVKWALLYSIVGVHSVGVTSVGVTLVW